jgi:hypothetical protein
MLCALDCSPSVTDKKIVQWVLQVMFPSACSFIVLVFTVFHYMFRPSWPSSSLNDIFIFICLKDSASLLFLCLFLRGHTLRVSICVFPVLFSFVVFVVSLRVCLSACIKKIVVN